MQRTLVQPSNFETNSGQPTIPKGLQIQESILNCTITARYILIFTENILTSNIFILTSRICILLYKTCCKQIKHFVVSNFGLLLVEKKLVLEKKEDEIIRILFIYLQGWNQRKIPVESIFPFVFTFIWMQPNR